MVNILAPNTKPCGTPDITVLLCERESLTQTWLFLYSMYVWNHLKAIYLFIYIIHIAIYGIHVTKQVTLKIQLEY